MLQHRAVAAGAGDPSTRMRARDRKRRGGLVPFWARATSIGYNQINGRSGRMIEEPAFRGSLINSPRNDTSACAERIVPASPLFPGFERRPAVMRGSGASLARPR